MVIDPSSSPSFLPPHIEPTIIGLPTSIALHRDGNQYNQFSNTAIPRLGDGNGIRREKVA
ncbi:hypothetical protein RE6C_04312 [Rhodopirellula europaea 6C]|uniref:Uncharacterized protein n=1 Tax=Rhodopirellula europaea 6C TaxID=1263867 RepID=M2AD67_9BACT|nr:hypothetical protein RE6C_04312 [Rhodopirellula europaea 6C]